MLIHWLILKCCEVQIGHKKTMKMDAENSEKKSSTFAHISIGVVFSCLCELDLLLTLQCTIELFKKDE